MAIAGTEPACESDWPIQWASSQWSGANGFSWIHNLSSCGRAWLEFPKRHVVQVDIADLPAGSPELRIAALLDQYRGMREERLAGESRRTQSASGLLITGLQQRLFSSIEAFAKTLAVPRKTVKKQWEQAFDRTGRHNIARLANGIGRR